MKDVFGVDVYELPETTESRPRDGVYTHLAQPWESVSFIAHIQDNPGHRCSRVCPKHGDAARWWDVKLSEFVP